MLGAGPVRKSLKRWVYIKILLLEHLDITLSIIDTHRATQSSSGMSISHLLLSEFISLLKSCNLRRATTIFFSTIFDPFAACLTAKF